MLSLSGFCFSPMPLVVAYQQVTQSDFAYALQHPNKCANENFSESYYSIKNIGVAYS